MFASEKSIAIRNTLRDNEKFHNLCHWKLSSQDDIALLLWSVSQAIIDYSGKEKESFTQQQTLEQIQKSGQNIILENKLHHLKEEKDAFSQEYKKLLKRNPWKGIDKYKAAFYKVFCKELKNHLSKIHDEPFEVKQLKKLKKLTGLYDFIEDVFDDLIQSVEYKDLVLLASDMKYYTLQQKKSSLTSLKKQLNEKHSSPLWNEIDWINIDFEDIERELWTSRNLDYTYFKRICLNSTYEKRKEILTTLLNFHNSDFSQASLFENTSRDDSTTWVLSNLQEIENIFSEEHLNLFKNDCRNEIASIRAEKSKSQNAIISYIRKESNISKIARKGLFEPALSYYRNREYHKKETNNQEIKKRIEILYTHSPQHQSEWIFKHICNHSVEIWNELLDVRRKRLKFFEDNKQLEIIFDEEVSN